MLFLYVDNGAFPFATQEEMTQGATVIFDHFARFGLEMPQTLIRWNLPLYWRVELKLKQR